MGPPTQSRFLGGAERVWHRVRSLFRPLFPVLFGLLLFVIWGFLLQVMAPDLVEFVQGTSRAESPAKRTRRLTRAISIVDKAVAAVIHQWTPGAEILRQEEELENLNGVEWRTTRIELELPPAQDVRTVAKAITELPFDARWQIKMEAFHIEPFSITLEISAMGYPTHLLTFFPTMSQAPPLNADSDTRVELAILVDDLGYSEEAVKTLWELDEPISVAILPFSPYALALAEAAYTHGKEVLVHLPLEPLKNPLGQALRAPLGQLTLSMPLDEVKKRTRRALRAVPYAVGANNHQGSAFMQDKAHTRAMLEVVKEERMFFVDSRTVARSLGYSLAKSMGLPTTSRQVFIDNDPDPEQIIKALSRLKSTAVKRGSALGIAHPHHTTMQVLRGWLPKAKEEGFKLVPVSSLLENQGRGSAEHAVH